MEQVQARRGREGSRWINERPSPQEVAEWFGSVVKLHSDSMQADDYVSGITLIQAVEKVDEIIGYDETTGRPVIEEDVRNVTFTPYMKVETRVAYFWDLMRIFRDDWIGVIEPVAAKGGDELGLPPGFFRYSAASPKESGKVVSFVGFSARVRVVKRAGAEWRDVGGLGPTKRRMLEGEPVFEALAGTKIVPVATRWDVDLNAMMKAETGAAGRALGMAGMLVLPGSGVATAEDMQEHLAATGAGATAEAATLPPAAPIPAEATPVAVATEPPDGDPALRRRAVELLKQLEELDAEKLKAFQEWARGRGFSSLGELGSTQLKGVVRKLEKEAESAAKAVGGAVDVDPGDGPSLTGGAS